MSKIVQLHIPCPKCPSSDGYCIWDDGHGYCYSCRYYKPANKKEEEELNTSLTYEYLPWRGVTLETMRRYGILTAVNAEGVPIHIKYRYANGAAKMRSLATKEFWSEGEISRAGLFGKDRFPKGSAKFITVTEGELDAASFNQVLGSQSPVVSVQSSTSARRDCSADFDYLNSFERVYLAFDGDEAGRRATREVARLFDPTKVYDVQLSRYKDGNGYVERGDFEELRKIWWNAKRFIPEGIINTIDEFEKLVQVRPKQGVSYPFPTITKMTYGLRTGESVLITAQEGVGKTELMHSIEYHLLKETNDAIGAIFLEEPKARHLQALAGLELRCPAHLPDAPCSMDEVVAALRRVVAKDDRLHIYSHFGSSDPDVLLDTIRFLVSGLQCRWVLLDHISMVVSGLQGDDERKALDYIATRLEMMVKELDFGLIFVSHVNDDGYTRGSRYISKVADIRIDAKRDIRNENEKERNTTYLTISKNRYSGMTGPAGRIVFNPETFVMTEEVPDELPV